MSQIIKDNCCLCGQFIHQGLLPIHDYYGVTDWICVRCSPISLEDYDRLMKDVPNNFKEQCSEELIQEFRQILSTLVMKGD